MKPITIRPVMSILGGYRVEIALADDPGEAQYIGSFDTIEGAGHAALGIFQTLDAADALATLRGVYTAPVRTNALASIEGI